MPPILGLLYVAFIFMVFRLLLGEYEYVYAFVPSLLMAYSAYLLVHYAVHAFRPASLRCSGRTTPFIITKTWGGLRRNPLR
ncbi:hypothetical protein ACFS7Z_26355, partial [Pontibacter toksunensis]